MERLVFVFKYSIKKNLNKFLLSGLDPAGVPKSLINSAIPFDDTNIDSLKKKLKIKKKNSSNCN